MISYIEGQVIDIADESLSLLCNGIGYEVFSSKFLLDKALPNDVLKLWIYTHVREDQLALFGFSSLSEKQLFLSLLKVNGVGPKLAMKILSGAPLERIIEMIEGEDVKSLSQLPKVGKKTAEQLILSLKGKLVFGERSVPAVDGKPVSHPRKDLISALTHLGFRIQDIEKTVAELPPEIEMEEGLRRSLGVLSNL